MRKQAEKIGTSGEMPNPTPKPGYSIWIESGTWYTAPTVNGDEFGGHAYDNGGYEKGIRDCPCGAWMLSSASGGPVDPFGACPKNPKPAQSPMPKMDWEQVVLNGGPPCFAVNTPNDLPNQYCGCAERWEGHGAHHEYLSLDDLLARGNKTSA